MGGFFQGTTLMLGNMAYFHLTLSFLQMVKALSPAVLFLILYLTGLDKWHAKVAMAGAVIIGCTLIASLGETSFTWVGFTLIFGAELTEAFKNALMQFLLANKKFSMWEGMYFISPASLIFLLLAARRSNSSTCVRTTLGLRRQLLFPRRHQAHRFSHPQSPRSAPIDSHHRLRRRLLPRRHPDANVRLRRRPRRFHRIQRRQGAGQGARD